MKKLTYILAFLASFLATPAQAELPRIIRFATEATYPPFEYIDASGKIKGFDIDIAQALCMRMKTQCTFTNQPWESLIPSLKLGKFDALIGALAITDVRKQQVDFTDAYFSNAGSFVAPTDKHLTLSPTGLRDKIIGVQGGTTMEQYLATEYGHEVKIKTYASQQDAFLDLTSGRLDAVLGDMPTVTDWLKKHDGNKYEMIGEPIESPKFFGVGYGIAVKKGNKELLDALNQALKDIKTDGTYERIADAYFANR